MWNISGQKRDIKRTTTHNKHLKVNNRVQNTSYAQVICVKVIEFLRVVKWVVKEFELRLSRGWVKTISSPNQDHYSENIHDWQRSAMYFSSSSTWLNIGLTAIVFSSFLKKSLKVLKKDWRLNNPHISSI